MGGEWVLAHGRTMAEGSFLDDADLNGVAVVVRSWPLMISGLIQSHGTDASVRACTRQKQRRTIRGKT